MLTTDYLHIFHSRQHAICPWNVTERKNPTITVGKITNMLVKHWMCTCMCMCMWMSMSLSMYMYMGMYKCQHCSLQPILLPPFFSPSCTISPPLLEQSLFNLDVGEQHAPTTLLGLSKESFLFFPGIHFPPLISLHLYLSIFLSFPAIYSPTNSSLAPLHSISHHKQPVGKNCCITQYSIILESAILNHSHWPQPHRFRSLCRWASMPQWLSWGLFPMPRRPQGQHNGRPSAPTVGAPRCHHTCVCCPSSGATPCRESARRSQVFRPEEHNIRTIFDGEKSAQRKDKKESEKTHVERRQVHSILKYQENGKRKLQLAQMRFVNSVFKSSDVRFDRIGRRVKCNAKIVLLHYVLNRWGNNRKPRISVLSPLYLNDFELN